MGYVHIPRAISGFGATTEASASASASGSASVSETPSESYANIIGTAPTADQIQADWQPAMDAVAKYKMEPTGDIDKNVQFMMSAMPMIVTAIGGKNVETTQALAMFANGTSPELTAVMHGDVKPMAIIALKAGAAYGCSYIGIPPELGMVTVDVLKDGEITDKDFEAAGGVGGAIGGAALAGFFGVPPSIGGFVGGKVGQLAGGVVADSLKIGGGRAEREAKRKERLAAEAIVRGELTAIRAQFSDMISLKRGEWWSFFDRVVETFGMQWQNLECAAFTRFPLLWEGGNGGMPFFDHPYDASTCTRPINKNLSRGIACLNTKSLLPFRSLVQNPRRPAGEKYVDCKMPIGCPYPSFPPLGASEWSERVTQAFAAYDIWWQPSPERGPIDEAWVNALPTPDQRPRDAAMLRSMGGLSWTAFIAKRSSEKKGCKSHACRVNVDHDIGIAIDAYKAELSAVADAALSFEAINAAAMRIAGDMTRTAGIYAAAVKISASKLELRRGDLDRVLARSKADAELIRKSAGDLQRALEHGQRMNRLVNYGMLVAGGALFAGSLIKVARS
jgi:hypothetical protein